MKVAIRLLITAFAIAAILWLLIITGLVARIGGFDAMMIFVRVIGYGHVVITTLLLISLTIAAAYLFRNSTARTGGNYFVVVISVISFVLADCYTYAFFYRWPPWD